EQILQRVTASRLPEQMRPVVNQVLFALTVRITIPPDSVWVRRLTPSRDLLLMAERALIEGDLLTTRTRLDSIVQAVSTSVPGQAAPDGVLAEARLALAIGDTSTATRLLDMTLAATPFLAPMTYRGGAGNTMTTA